MPTPRSPTDVGVAHRLEARLLGGLSLRHDGQPLPETAFRRRKSLTLLLRLLASPGHRLPVDTILEMLWPEEDPQASAVHLRAVLSEVRVALPQRGTPNPVVRLDASLALDPALDLALDLDWFEAAATSGLADGDPAALRRALALYAGPLLPGLPYEEWALERRAALARLHRQVVLALAADGDPATEERLRDLLAEDPADEQVGQALMRLLGAQGRRAEGLRAYHALLKALEEELGVEPGPETAALHAALLEPPAAREQGAGASPSPAALDAQRHNLPAALSSFVGRAWELAELRQLLARTRLLTVTGPGGCGKTRLALAVAEERLPSFPDGAWLVELAPMDAEAAVAPVAARALGLREEPGRLILDTLASHLAGRTALLLLDNCEHVLAECAGLAEALLRACPGLRILATSRERLGLTGESAWAVPPLSLPMHGPGHGPDGAPTLAQLAQAEAVQLFVERVRGMRPGFALNTHNARGVDQVCRRLDGIPLALELAAARAGALGVEQIAARLDDRFRLLTGGSRAALPRQRTLRASMDWSYDLLAEAERALLRRLAVFAGGWTLEAAEAVCAGDGIEAAAVLDLLDGLAGKSLVQVDQTEAGIVRYGLLETMRQYAGERLEERGERAMLQARHLAWCVGLAEEAMPQLLGATQETWLERLEAEHDNLRSALTWSIREGADPAAGVQLAGALWRFWQVRGHLSEGRAWLGEALAHDPGAPPALRARALTGAGVLAEHQGEYEQAIALHEESLALSRQLGDRRSIAASLSNLGQVVCSRGDLGHAQALHEESLAIMHELGDSLGVSVALNNLGWVAFARGEYARAAALHEESLGRARRFANPWRIAISLYNLGGAVYALGDYARAATLLEESLALAREIGDTVGIAGALNSLGAVTYVLGEYGRAVAQYEEGLALERMLGNKGGMANALHNLGEVAFAQGEYGRATALYEESLALEREIGRKDGIAASLHNLGAVAERQGDYGRAVDLYEESLRLGRAIGANNLLALGIERLAWMAVARGQPERAARIGGAAEALREAIGAAPQPHLQAGHDRAAQSMRAALGEEAFAAAWEAGHALSLEQALACALDDLQAGYPLEGVLQAGDHPADRA